MLRGANGHGERIAALEADMDHVAKGIGEIKEALAENAEKANADREKIKDSVGGLADKFSSIENQTIGGKKVLMLLVTIAGSGPLYWLFSKLAPFIWVKP